MTRQRGQPIPSELGPVVVATLHPSAVLRARDDDERRQMLGDLVDDLRLVADLLGSRALSPS